MSLSGKSVSNIRLTRRYSTRLFAYCTFVVSITALATISLSVNGNHAMLTLLPLLMLAYVSALRKYVYLSASNAVLQIRRDSTNTWTIAYDNKEVVGRLQGSSFVSAGLIVLRFSMPGRFRTESVVLLPDSIGKEVFHRLLIDLRTQVAFDDQAI